MSRFVLQPDPVKKKRKRIWDIVAVITWVSLFLIFVFDRRPAGTERLFTQIARLLFCVVMIWMPAARLFTKRHEMFVEVNDLFIAYRLSEWGSDKEHLRSIAWEDIKWIKQESDFSVSVFQASSFNAHFSIKSFTPGDQEKILTEIKTIAEAKLVRLANFSELFVWKA